MKNLFFILPLIALFLVQTAWSQPHQQMRFAGPEQNRVGQNWGLGHGLLMFRGNPMRNFYGLGEVPTQAPQLRWRYPQSPMCSSSCVGSQCSQWCGTGWTGQPIVYHPQSLASLHRPPVQTELAFGAYDRRVHFVNAETGRPSRAPFLTGDLIKGSVTLDPDGFPLLYFGSRDNFYRIVALDQEPVRELWRLDGNSARPRVWNDDWDGNGVIYDDFLFIGGENSWFYIIKLNRGFDENRRVKVQPEIVFQFPAFPQELVALVGDRMTSIESSPAIFGDRVYFANSAGYVVGIDISRRHQGQFSKVFEFWAGDDIDSTPVIDADGSLYISVELELDGARQRSFAATQVRNMGQLIKINPYVPSLPLREQIRPAKDHASVLWKLDIPATGGDRRGGIWSTPALDHSRKMLYVTTHPGELLGVDSQTGIVQWRHRLGYHEWSSPLVVNRALMVGRCSQGGIEAFDISAPSSISSIWQTPVRTGCIESTPAFWQGSLFVGSRDGYFYHFR